MKTMTTKAAALFLCVAAGATSWAATEPGMSRELKAAVADQRRGIKQLDRVTTEDTNAERLYRLRQAQMYLRRADKSLDRRPLTESVARLQAENDRLMVGALVSEAEIYYSRRSLPLAQKRIEAARAIDPDDARVCVLQDMILEAQANDVWSPSTGTVALRRVLDRRAGIGVPFRDRGLGSRFR